MSRKKYGGIYEIALPENKYLYVCLIERLHFGVFDICPNKPINDVGEILAHPIKLYQACKETAVNKRIWRLVGMADLEQAGISYPELLAIYLAWNKTYSFEQLKAMKNDGNPVAISREEYMDLLDKGLIYGFFSDYRAFEQWLSLFFADYPAGVLDCKIMTERIGAGGRLKTNL